jgi:hypothetical protein
VSALGDARQCLPAANALRKLCDATRSALALHIAAKTAFDVLHAVPGFRESAVDRQCDAACWSAWQLLLFCFAFIMISCREHDTKSIMQLVVAKLFQASRRCWLLGTSGT